MPITFETYNNRTLLNDNLKNISCTLEFLCSGGGIGVVYIDDLEDVDTTTNAPIVGQVLVWDGVNWVPGSGLGGGDFFADGSVPMTGDLDMGGNDIINVGTVVGYTLTVDLASNANGYGASLLGIEDAAGYYVGSTVEEALQELGSIQYTSFISDLLSPTYYYYGKHVVGDVTDYLLTRYLKGAVSGTAEFNSTGYPDFATAWADRVNATYSP